MKKKIIILVTILLLILFILNSAYDTFLQSKRQLFSINQSCFFEAKSIERDILGLKDGKSQISLSDHQTISALNNIQLRINVVNSKISEIQHFNYPPYNITRAKIDSIQGILNEVQIHSRIEIIKEYVYDNTDIVKHTSTNFITEDLSWYKIYTSSTDNINTIIAESVQFFTRKEVINIGIHPLMEKYGWDGYTIKHVIDGDIWIGMPITGVIYQRGNPNSINVSNYGGGIRKQYCWHNYYPGYFYDDNDDGLVDAYNDGLVDAYN